MYKLIKYCEKYKEKWNSYAKANGTIFHLIEWKEILEESFKYKSSYYFVTDINGEIEGLVPLITGRNYLLKRIGVSLPFTNYLDICCTKDIVLKYIIEKLKGMVISKKLKYIEIRMKEQNIPEESDCADVHNFTFILPLDGDEADILSYSTSDNRNHIKKAYRSNEFSVSFNIEKLGEFYEVWRERQKQLGTPDHGLILFKKIYEKFRDNTFLLTVESKESGKVLGGMFLIAWGDTIFYNWGGAKTAYNRKHINEFMYWEAVKFGLYNNYKYLDLGRSPHNPQSGTYRAKKKWGARPVQLRYYRLGGGMKDNDTLNNAGIKAAVKIWRKIPSFITNYAGKRLIKYIMP